ncbi:MAG: carboxylic acid reductase [Caulobacterales bacterium]
MAEEFNLQHYIDLSEKRIWEMAKNDPELKNLVPDEAVTASIQEPGLSYQTIIDRILTAYANRPAFGVRDYKIQSDAKTGEQIRHYLPAFKTISYRELQRQIQGVASCWRHHPQHKVAHGEMVSFIAFSGAEMAAVDLACNYAQSVSVPLQANLPSEQMQEILRDTAPAALAASIDNLELAAGYALQQDSIRSLIVLDYDERVDAERRIYEETLARLAQAGGRLTLTTFSEIVEYGSQHKFEMLPDPADGLDHISMIMYTSGSTGAPKGAMIHDAISAQFWSRIAAYRPVVTIAYAPMNHFMGRNMVHGPLAQGGTSYFSLKSDMSTLFEDIRLSRPTFMLMIPRVCELVYQHYMSETQRRIAEGEDAAKADAEVRAEMHGKYLGDRLNSAGVGSSPTAPEVRQFISECFNIPLFEGYGSTEAGAAAMTTLNRVDRAMIVDYKLADVPELNYYTTDRPYPRGELLVKTNYLIKGYFKRPDATASIFDEHGYLKTGDIMEERGPDHLVWVDRRNNVIKLSQAEFVAIGPLESVYLGHSKFIKQIFVYGSSYRSFLLAVVVPDVEVAKARLGHEASIAELRNLALVDLQEAARSAGLKSFEVPRDVLVELNPFTLENGLLSSVRKPLRPNLKRRYADELEAMYQDMDRQQQEELAALRSSATGASTLERTAAAFKANLGLASINKDDAQGFTDLGGDSLGAVGLSILLEEMFGVSVPVSLLLHPAASAKRVADYVDEILASGDSYGVTYESVHPDAEAVRASDLKLEVFFDADTLTAAKKAAAPTDTIRTVLLTGANGFLGRFLCLEWMKKLAKVDGKVICLVRGKDADAARARLDEAFGTLDRNLAKRFRDLAAKHLQMLTGDLSAPRFGLDEAAFNALAEQVDHIVHPAALVNHRMTYRNLFEPNVRGTAELIRLALTKRQKRFDYVSTVAVPHMSPDLAKGAEKMDVRKGAATVPLSDIYASGYGASKWAGEVLLREANDAFGLPANVFRADMIMPHSEFRAQYNPTDMFTRLLFSTVHTGLAPKSFYQLEADGSRPRAHYDGLPVDFLAAAMQQIGGQAYSGFHSYNMINLHHDDGVSLDSVIDWVISAGYKVQRIDDHKAWMNRFADKLRNLPDDQRQHSSLSILGHFEQPHEAHPKPISSKDFEAVVRTIPAGPEVPHLTERYIHKYLDDMRLVGLIGEPALAAT